MHQDLDHVASLDRHALGEIGDRYRLGHLDIANHGCCRLFELVLTRDFVHLFLALLELLLAIGLMCRFLDVQFLAPVTGMAVFVLAVFSGLVGGGGRTGRGCLFQRCTRGGFGGLGGFGFGALFFDFLLRRFDFLQAFLISLLFRLGTRGFLGGRLCRLGFSLGRRFGLAGRFLGLLLL